MKNLIATLALVSLSGTASANMAKSDNVNSASCLLTAQKRIVKASGEIELVEVKPASKSNVFKLDLSKEYFIGEAPYAYLTLWEEAADGQENPHNINLEFGIFLEKGKLTVSGSDEALSNSRMQIDEEGNRTDESVGVSQTMKLKRGESINILSAGPLLDNKDTAIPNASLVYRIQCEVK